MKSHRKSSNRQFLSCILKAGSALNDLTSFWTTLPMGIRLITATFQQPDRRTWFMVITKALIIDSWATGSHYFAMCHFSCVQSGILHAMTISHYLPDITKRNETPIWRDSECLPTLMTAVFRRRGLSAIILFPYKGIDRRFQVMTVESYGNGILQYLCRELIGQFIIESNRIWPFYFPPTESTMLI